LLGALAIKLLVQLLVAQRLGLDRDEVRAWPLGDLGRPGLSASERSTESVVSVIAGMLANLTVAASLYLSLRMAGAAMVLNPFGYEKTGGAPFFNAATTASAFTTFWWFGQFGYINWVLFLVNLLPALPLDGGRIFRPILAMRSRDHLIGPWTAHALAIVLGIVAVIRWLYSVRTGIDLNHPNAGSGDLIALAILIELMVRIEVRTHDESGFFEDGVFGYDFSQGYTSLEGGAATVRPPREGALQRWKRRRSEDRRRRQRAREAAEENRMDVILAKIHTEGRSSLSADEERFLVQLSTKYKKRVQGP
jgi:hypothetical protein